MRRFFFTLVTSLIVAMPIVACSSDDTAPVPECSAGSSCKNQPAKSADELKACNQAKADSRCSGYYNNLLTCLQKNETCGADGKTDFAATDAKCGAARQSWHDCLQVPVDAGSGG
jgi:hypothetical protein